VGAARGPVGRVGGQGPVSSPSDSSKRAAAELLPALLESTVDLGLEASFEVAGFSMLPLIRPGDKVHVGPPRNSGVRVGDVVAVRAAPGGRLVVHRVVGRKGEGVVLHGDNAARTDGTFDERDVIAVVDSVRREGRNVWFGAGRWGPLVALAARSGVLRRFNQAVYPAYRALGRDRLRRSGGEK